MEDCSLLPDDGLGEKWFTKDMSLSGPLETFLNNHPRASDTRATHDPSFVLIVSPSYLSMGIKEHVILR